MNIEGTVHAILDLQTFDSGFTKQVLVIKTDEKYPQTIPVEFVKDKTSLLTGLKKDQKVNVSINLRGNEYNNKYYASVQGWKIDNVANEVAPSPEPIGDTGLPF